MQKTIQQHSGQHQRDSNEAEYRHRKQIHEWGYQRDAAKYQNYKRLVFVAHDAQDMDTYRLKAQEVAEFCQRWGMQYEEILGSDEYVCRLIEIAAALDKTDDEFLVIPPGGEITQDMFLR